MKIGTGIDAKDDLYGQAVARVRAIRARLCRLSSCLTMGAGLTSGKLVGHRCACDPANQRHPQGAVSPGPAAFASTTALLLQSTLSRRHRHGAARCLPCHSSRVLPYLGGSQDPADRHAAAPGANGSSPFLAILKVALTVAAGIGGALALVVAFAGNVCLSGMTPAAGLATPQLRNNSATRSPPSASPVSTPRRTLPMNGSSNGNRASTFFAPTCDCPGLRAKRSQFLETGGFRPRLHPRS